MQDDEDEDDQINPNNTTDDKPMNMSNDEQSGSSMHHEGDGPDNRSTVFKPLNAGKEAKDIVSIPSAAQSSLPVPASSSSSNKTEASPREITKARSPSSLSEASPSAD